MITLQKMFPSLTLFSDIDWEAVSQEYKSDYPDLSFPEYLQQKADDGDCPPYLFELAYYELALLETKNSNESLPSGTGIYLNPTALFLSLEFDVERMLKEANQGNIEVYERDHVLCLYRNAQNEIKIIEMNEEDLDLLQHLEDGPQTNNTFIENQDVFTKLAQIGLILNFL